MSGAHRAVKTVSRARGLNTIQTVLSDELDSDQKLHTRKHVEGQAILLPLLVAVFLLDWAENKKAYLDLSRLPFEVVAITSKTYPQVCMASQMLPKHPYILLPH